MSLILFIVDKVAKARRKKKLGSYPYFSVIFSITLALFVFGLFSTLVIYSQKLASQIRQNVEIQIYLRKNLSESQQISIRQTLATQPYIANENGSPKIEFISKEDAAEDFKKNTGEDFEFLGENPLRDAYVIKINDGFHTEAKMDSIRNEITKISGVYEVAYVKNLIRSINKNITEISLILIGFTLILIIVVIILINNTIKLALFSQRFLIRSMQLVGATQSFIIRPFLLRSVLHGFLAALFACGGILLAINYAYRRIEELKDLEDRNLLIILLGTLVISGVILGFLSTYRAARKYMNMSLDELY